MTSLLVIGLLTGVASGLFGVGGGFILIPLLALLGVPLQTAIGASLVYVVGTSLSGALRHLRQGTADWRLALPLTLASGTTAVAGSLLGTRVPERALGATFAALTALALVLFNLPAARRPRRPAAGPHGRWWVRRRRVLDGAAYDYRFHLGRVSATGALLGLVTGLLGVGGGFILVPMLVGLARIPLPVAIGTSLLSILAAAAAGAVAHGSRLGVSPSLVLPLVAAGILGAQVGAWLVLRLPAARLRLVFNVLLLSATGYMLARAIGLADPGGAAGVWSVPLLPAPGSKAGRTVASRGPGLPGCRGRW